MRNDACCSICKRPVVDGQAYYSITGNHYDCEFPRGRQTADQLIAELDEKLAASGIKPKRRKAQEGTGATATRAKTLAIAAIEAALGESLFDVTLWNQQGAYRGARWDLDRWGLCFSFRRDGHTFKGQASSLATMTDCVKAGVMKATPSSGMAFDFSIEPT